MKPKLLHQEAMDFSFKAKQASLEGNYSLAFDLYKEAAEFESKVARFYFEKPDLEPTRSVLIRSAAFLNLKAGLIKEAQEFIIFGLLNVEDDLIKNQLNEALEIAISLRNLNPEAASQEYNYLSILRQKSVHYILEPTIGSFGGSVSLDMVQNFTNNFLKSLRSYASASVTRLNKEIKLTEDAVKEFVKQVNPLITNSAYGSFKFSIANDYLSRQGENPEIAKLKSDIIQKYHDNIFTNPLQDDDIKALKENYTEEEINEIFRPLTKIKSRNSHYKVGYYNSESFNKIYASRIENEQKKKLLPIKRLNQDEIGQLENSIIHKKPIGSGKFSKKILISEELKKFEFDHSIKEISPSNKSSILLNEELLLNISFDSNDGFHFYFSDLDIENEDTEFDKGLQKLNDLIYQKIVNLVNRTDKNDSEVSEYNYVKKIIGNPDSLKL